MRVAMIATHPANGDGVASYTSNLAQRLIARNVEVVLFVNKPTKRFDEDQRTYVCWSRGLWYPLQIFRAIMRKQPQIVHIQHEFFLFGGVISAALFPFLLILIKLLKKPLVITFHGVISPSIVDRQFLKVNGMKGNPLMFKIGANILVRLASIFSDCLIVHERFFAETLRTEYGCDKAKIRIIPHGVESKSQKMSIDKAKRELGLASNKIVLFFGYLAPYKGIDTLIEGFSLVAGKHKDWRLIICGDVHPRLVSDQDYKEYLRGLRSRVASSAPSQIMFTGFIPNEIVGLYFSAADLVVLPYKVAMASSGPLALALSYERKILVSRIPSFEKLLPLKEIILLIMQETALGPL
jgi:glycosyltransferase involved in cell wall biosynthesis